MYIGIDTSCYTTSIAVVAKNGELVAEARRILEVTKGSRGLQQSAAIFQHITEGRQVISSCLDQLDLSNKQILGIGVSVRPRPYDDSYMPVFLAGLNDAQILAAAFKVPLFETSHQEGHLMAGILTTGLPRNERFLAVHLSGGTTEIMLVEPNAKGFDVQLLGGTLDLHGGQLVDRVGVLLGLSFPCGPQLDKLAMENTNSVAAAKIAVTDMSFHLSGFENKANILLESGNNHQSIAAFVFEALAKSLAQALQNAREQTGITQVLLVGGVAGSQRLKGRLLELLTDMDLYFTPPSYAKDNAWGVAALAKEYFEQ